MGDYLNKIMLKGRIGNDPALRFLPSGDSVINFSVATKSGNHIEWHAIVAYKETADRVKSDMFSGDLVFVEGEVKSRNILSAEDKANNKKPKIVREIIADSVYLLSKAAKNVVAVEAVNVIEVDDLENEVSQQDSRDDDIPAYI